MLSCARERLFQVGRQVFDVRLSRRRHAADRSGTMLALRLGSGRRRSTNVYEDRRGWWRARATVTASTSGVGTCGAAAHAEGDTNRRPAEVCRGGAGAGGWYVRPWYWDLVESCGYGSARCLRRVRCALRGRALEAQRQRNEGARRQRKDARGRPDARPPA